VIQSGASKLRYDRDGGGAGFDGTTGEPVRFKDKVVLVTGASRGIGKEIAVAFAREGADIVVGRRRSSPTHASRDDPRRRRRSRHSDAALLFAVDLRKDDQVEAPSPRRSPGWGASTSS
jgi:NADP-dependent 3-hydroxy acid dehydrogenase YdfG